MLQENTELYPMHAACAVACVSVSNTLPPAITYLPVLPIAYLQLPPAITYLPIIPITYLQLHPAITYQSILPITYLQLWNEPLTIPWLLTWISQLLRQPALTISILLIRSLVPTIITQPRLFSK